MEVKVMNQKYLIALQTHIRSSKTDGEALRGFLVQIGKKIGEEIVTENMLNEVKVLTPMGEIFNGYEINQSVNLVYSTKDDYSFFANGISSVLPNCLQGFLDFGGSRGTEALNQPVRAVSHPSVSEGLKIKNVIIAKSVLATGCTAISIAKNINEKYSPENLIIASAFFSDIGINELKQEIPNIQSIYVVGKADYLNSQGMLIPGVGDIDRRMTS
jgi:uracil phosphoribosyltransferase